MITCKETEYKNYGKCLTISNGLIEIYVTVDVGPRIIKCNVADGENLMKNDVERKFSEDVSSAFGENERWYIYGGHRMWVSPENMPLSYYPDNNKLVYELTPGGAVFKPAAQRVNNMRHELEIAMSADKPELDVVHRLTNESEETVEGAIWALSVMDAGGVAIVPQPKEDTGLLGNRVLALWPYTKMEDSRVFWGSDYIALRQDVTVEDKFKLGVNNTSGWLAYINHGQALIKSYAPAHGTEKYPDFGVSTELFTNSGFLEAETLSPLYAIAPEETVSHTERWRLVGGVEKPVFTAESVQSTVKGLSL